MTQVTSHHGVVIATQALANATTGSTFDMYGAGDITVTATGTFGGATVTIQGSNDNVTFMTIDDFLGTAITFTADGMNTFGNSPLFVRAVSAGGAGTAVTVIFAGKPYRK